MGWGATVLHVVESLIGIGEGRQRKSQIVGLGTKLQIMNIAILTETQLHNPISKFQKPETRLSHNLLRSSKPDLT